MAFFIPASIQKRLLRYALSRVELLDIDELDLDSLGIAFGRTSTIELKDVALRRNKLSSILHFPPNLSFQVAKVHSLVLSVPADLHVSPIVVSLNGIEVGVKVSPENSSPISPPAKQRRSKQTYATDAARSTTAAASTDSRPAKETSRPRYEDDNELDTDREPSLGDDQIIPAPHEIAKSFLAEEPLSEKRQLEVALASQSVDLRQPFASGTDDDDSDVPEGLGVAFALPSFLAAFLKGIGDRLQVRVENLQITLDIQLDLPGPEHPQLSGQTAATAPTTFFLHIDAIELKGKESSLQTPSSPQPPLSGFSQKKEPSVPNLADTRYISLRGLNFSVSSEPAVFEQLSRYLDKESSFKSKSSGPAPSDARPSTVSTLDDPSLLASTSLRGQESPLGSQSSFSKQVWADTTSERQSDAAASLTNQTETKLPSYGFQHDHSLPETDNVTPWDETNRLGSSALITDSMMLSKEQFDYRGDFANSLNDLIAPDTSANPFRASQPSDNTSKLEESPQEKIYNPLDSFLEASYQERAQTRHVPGQFRRDSFASSKLSKEASLYEQPTGAIQVPEQPILEDLSESKVFSHDEAESIYASALLDNAQASEAKSTMPGGWHGPEDGSNISEMRPDSEEIKSKTAELLVEKSEGSSEPAETLIGDQPQPPSPDNGNITKTNTDTSDKPGRSKTQDHKPLSAKEILSIDCIDVRLSPPQACEDSAVPAFTSRDSFRDISDTDRDGGSHMPGSFSIYAQSTSSIRRQEHLRSSQSQFRPRPETVSPSEPRNPMGSATVSLGSVGLRLDVSVARLLFQLQQKLQSLAGSYNQSQKGEVKSDGTDNILNVGLKQLSLCFAEQIVAVSMERDRPFSPLDASKAVNILFQATASNLELQRTTTRELQEAKLEVGEFKFGFSDEDIVSFSKDAALQSSIRDLKQSFRKDFSVGVKYGEGTLDVLIESSPLKIDLDVQKLDRTLGSIGGLSGLIELGSSITSENTVTANSPKVPQRKRSVHFDSNQIQQIHPATQPQQKTNVRLAGASITLKGDSCKIHIQSSAVKLIARRSHTALQIDDMNLTGPWKGIRTGLPSLSIRLRDTRLTYLHNPEEADLTRLISLLTPSKDKFEGDDDLLLDTLLKQRRKGAVLRIATTSCEANVNDLHAIALFQDFGTELSKLSAVTKYLPEESRPGLMILGLLQQIHLRIFVEGSLGTVDLNLKSIDLAHISGPFLLAAAVQSIRSDIDGSKPLFTEVLPVEGTLLTPMLMIRMLGDDLQPMIKVKLYNACLEYSVAVAMSLSETFNNSLAVAGNKIDNIGSPASMNFNLPTRTSTSSSDSSSNSTVPLNFDITFRDCVLGLTPLKLTSKIAVVLVNANIIGAVPVNDDLDIKIAIHKGSVLLIDDSRKLQRSIDVPANVAQNNNTIVKDPIHELGKRGYVSMSYVSAAEARIRSYKLTEENINMLDVDFKDELFVLESCADSTQTLINTLNDLSPPKPPSKGEKYRTEIAPIEDMMASFTGDTLTLRGRGAQASTHDDVDEFYENAIADDDMTADEDFEGGEFDFRPGELEDDLEDYASSRIYSASEIGSTLYQQEGISSTTFDIQDNFTGELAPGALPPRTQGIANKWDSSRNRYVPLNQSELFKCPLKVRLHDLHIIWNLYDGYDWEKTRETITKAVEDVETKAMHRQERFNYAHDEADDQESIIGDFLFNSIYIGVPVNQDPRELSRQINHNIDDLASETTSYASSNTSRPSAASKKARSNGHKLRLERSKRHKIAFELRGVSADIFNFPPGEETQSSFDVRVYDLEIFDHVPTSTWKKFATYMHDAGPREERKPMIHLEICDVRPVPDLTASELVIRVTVLPLRLHVDQDALDFITRFFDFKDDPSVSAETAAEQPYLQRVEVRPVAVKLDYKPKKIDYAGLRSGRTTEFMNFFILDGAEMVMKHAIVYGTSGFAKLHHSLEDVWMPDIRNNQLPSVLSGLNGVRTLVNVGSGVRDLLVVPIREYQKDGRIMRSISKGAMAFAKTTGSELSRFGAKLAIGAQTALQGAEDYLVGSGGRGGESDSAWTTAEGDSEERRTVSNYANQPAGILQGLKGAARSLERDLLLTKDIIIAISGEVRESGSADGAARVVARNAPTLILRPMIGASKAISQTLMGVTNTVDPQNKRRVEDKYKKY